MKQILEITKMGAMTFSVNKFYIKNYAWTNDKMPSSIRANNNRDAYEVITKKSRLEVEEFLDDSIIVTGFTSYIYMLSEEELTQAILFLS